MDGKVLELVVYKLNEGVGRDEFLELNTAVSTWIREQPGFISRELAYDSEGERWVDILWWETMEQAHAASERAMTSESCAPMFAQIDDGSTLMLHAVPAADTVTAAAPAGVAG